MMNEKQVPIEDLRAAVQEILYTVSGAYCSEFWDGMREVCDSLGTVKAIKKAIELLRVSGHDINLFRAVGDSDIEKQMSLKTALTSAELQSLKAVEAAVKEANVPNAQTIHAYNDIVIKKLLPLEYITHNAVILFVLEFFENHTQVKKFYQSYYPLVVVDEFQDTNCIAWALLESVISDQTQLLFLGDPLQRIYGFIGALPNIMSKVVDEYGMTKVVLAKNYRFRNNPEMLKLDKNIRANAASCFTRMRPLVRVQ